MSLSSPEVIEFCKTLSPGDRVKGLQHSQMLCSVVPNEWYTVKNIEVRPYYWDKKDGEEVVIVLEEFPDNKFSPYWFGICDAYSQVLNADRNKFIMQTETKVRDFLSKIKPGNEVKATSATEWCGVKTTSIDLTPNKWYVVCGVNNDAGSIIVINDKGLESAYCPSWFEITTEGRKKLTQNAALRVMAAPTLTTESPSPQKPKSQWVSKTISWAVVEPFKKTVQLAVFGGILFTGYKTVTDPTFFLKLLPKIQIEIGNQGK